MREYKIYLASALFICLSAVKLCFPQIPEQLRREAGELLYSNADCSGAVQAMGRSLARGQLDAQLAEVLEYISPREGQAVPAGETWASPPPGGAAAAEEDASGASKAAGSALPDNVSLETPQLPFEYSSPAAGRVSSCFGPREDPLDGEADFHYGTDIAGESGDEVLAFARGLVSAAGADDGYGNYCVIQHPGGYSTLYAHLSEFLVSQGEEVEMGQTIGYVGQSGRATGAHLHFELICDGMYLDPENYL